jgi:hypothetical protein
MLKALKHSSANRQTWVRRLALFFLIIFIVVSLTAQITIIANANHKCIGDGCPICKLIHNAEMLLKEMGKISVAICAVCTALFIMASVMAAVGLVCNHSSTLVNIKVRLNN